MQKISSYLYPNRINVVADIAVFPVRWNIVYQNRVKIYQGVDNVLTIDVKNAEQKRIDISDMQLEMCITDINNRLLTTASLIATTTTGLATVTVPASSLASTSPQFLNFAIYRINEDQTKTLLYADTQFSAQGNMVLIGNAIPTATPARYITRWLSKTNDSVPPPWITTWYSDAVEITQPNFLQDPAFDSVDFTFLFTSLAGTVTVEFTKDPVISSSTTWETIDSFAVSSSTTGITKTYSAAQGTYSREWTWARVRYERETANTGHIDKVTVQL